MQITVSDDAYAALKQVTLAGETPSDTLLRLCRGEPLPGPLSPEQAAHWRRILGEEWQRVLKEHWQQVSR